MAVALQCALMWIHPDSLYTKRGFIACSGISDTRLREAKKLYRLECRRFWVGKGCFYRGADIIVFLELLSGEEIRKHCQSQEAAT